MLQTPRPLDLPICNLYIAKEINKTRSNPITIKHFGLSFPSEITSLKNATDLTQSTNNLCTSLLSAMNSQLRAEFGEIHSILFSAPTLKSLLETAYNRNIVLLFWKSIHPSDPLPELSSSAIINTTADTIRQWLNTHGSQVERIQYCSQQEPLSTIPKGIRLCTNLQELIVGNSLLHIPSELYGLPKLVRYQEGSSLNPSTSTQMEDTTTFRSKYDRQVIIDLGSGATAQGLLRKANKPSPALPTTIIQFQTIDASIEAMRNAFLLLTPQSRLHVIGHCSAGNSALSTEQYVYLPVNLLAGLIKAYAPQVCGTTTPLTISIFACQSAARTTSEMSFCERLSILLDLHGIFAKVLGHIPTVQRSSDEGDFHKYTAGHVYRGHQTKVCFQTHERKTTATFVY